MLFALTPLIVAVAHAEGTTWSYAGPAGQSEADLDTIVKGVLAAPDARHYLWQPGWPDWKSWQDVPEIKAAVEKARAPAPPPGPAAPAAEATWSYSDGGAPVQLSTAEVRARVAANPSGRHLVWQAGMADWANPSTLPAFAPPAPPVATAPPPPPTATPAPPPPPSGSPPPPGAGPRAESGPGMPAEGGPPRRGRGHHGGDGRPPVKVGAEVWTGFGVRLASATAAPTEDATGTTTEEPAASTEPSTSFGADTTRVRPYVKAHLGEHFVAKVAIDGGQDASGSGWDLHAHEAWVQGAFETGSADHHLRVGAQETVFGTRDSFEELENYYLGGEAAQSLPQRFGALYGEDLGLAWHSGVGETFGVDVQVTDGAGVEHLDEDGAVDLVARVTTRPVKAFALWGSFLTGGREVEGAAARLTLGDLAAEVTAGPVRVTVEGMMGSTGNADFNFPVAGGLGAAAVDLPMKGAVDHVGIVGRFGFYDPVFVSREQRDVPDSLTSGAAAVNLHWKTPERTHALTGLAWEMVYPEDATVPITQNITLQFAAKF